MQIQYTYSCSNTICCREQPLDELVIEASVIAMVRQRQLLHIHSEETWLFMVMAFMIQLLDEAWWTIMFNLTESSKATVAVVGSIDARLRSSC